MRKSYLIAGLVLCLSAGLGASVASAQNLELISRQSDADGGAQANGESFTPFPRTSADGRFVVFASTATNLVPGAVNKQVYLFDRETGGLELISRRDVADGGAQGNGPSEWPAISADGRYVAFSSGATNLIPGGGADANFGTDVFLLDRDTGALELISRQDIADGGAQANDRSERPLLSADGRYVTFLSYATNLIPGGGTDVNGSQPDVFLFDRDTGGLELISRQDAADGGAQGDGFSSNPSISADGRYVSFASGSTNLIPGGGTDANGTENDVFLFDRNTGGLELISRQDIADGGAQGNASSSSSALSADGRFVAFNSSATNLIPGGGTDVNGDAWDVFLFDRDTGALELISRQDIADGGAQGQGGTLGSFVTVGTGISADGRFVAFESSMNNLIPGGGPDANGLEFDAFLFDRETERLRLVGRQDAADGGAQGERGTEYPSLSADGRYVVFQSMSTNLIPGGGTDVNGLAYDVFAFGPIQAPSVAEITIDDTWRTVELPADLVDPVVIVGPPTANDPAPGVVRLQQVTDSSFEVRFQEWVYLDDVHGEERLSYLVAETGGEVAPDGSIVEIGRFPLGGTGRFQAQSFSQPFPEPPLLLLTVQTFRGGEPVTVRARNLTAGGFEAALYEEEALMNGHTTEEVGYVAVYMPEDSGVLEIGGQYFPYTIPSLSIDDRFTPVLSSALKLEEEASADAEVGHTKEQLSAIALGGHLFAQDVSSRGRDTVALRRLAPSFPAPMEWGTVDGVTHDWATVPLYRAYKNPVVVARPVSSKGSDPGVIRLQNVTGRSFELRYQEWDYLGGTHIPERVFYMVAEAGETSLAGLTVEAGTLDTSRLLRGGLDPVTFASSFIDAPALFTSVATYNGADPVTTRVAGLNATGFGIAMSEEEASAGGHATETLSWIALERGSGTTADGRAVTVFNDGASSQFSLVPFGQTFDRLFPVFLGDVVTTRGDDPVFLRYRSLTPGSVQLRLQEEQSFDPETGHSSETVSIFVGE